MINLIFTAWMNRLQIPNKNAFNFGISILCTVQILTDVVILKKEENNNIYCFVFVCLNEKVYACM